MSMHSYAINISAGHHHFEIMNIVKSVCLFHIVYCRFCLIQYVKRIYTSDIFQESLLENKFHLRLFWAVSSARLF